MKVAAQGLQRGRCLCETLACCWEHCWNRFNSFSAATGCSLQTASERLVQGHPQDNNRRRTGNSYFRSYTHTFFSSHKECEPNTLEPRCLLKQELDLSGRSSRATPPPPRSAPGPSDTPALVPGIAYPPPESEAELLGPG